MDEELSPIIIENGSNMTKAGFSGDKDPRTVFPTVDCPTKYMFYIGDTTTARMRCLDIQYPIKNGYIVHWDHIFFKELHVYPQNHPVLISISPQCPKLNREKMIEIMFDRFNVPSCFFLEYWGSISSSFWSNNKCCC